MKLIFKQYLASLKERGELDALLPDLLSELGYKVLSRPSIGNKQYGVDVAAIGKNASGEDSVFLFSVKSGDLRRRDWDVGEQALRPSLNEIRDFYISKLIPSRHRNLPVVICLSFGGDLHEDIRGTVEGYISENETDHISYQIWDGDELADLLLSGILREQALPETWRSDLRKAVAFADEADVCFGHFVRLAKSNVSNCGPTKKAKLTAMRQIYVAVWTLFAWCREAGRLEAAYLCSERAVLIAWALGKDDLEGRSQASKQIVACIDRLILLHRLIAEQVFKQNVAPRAGILHGLTASIPSHAYLDKNLTLFDCLGRTALHGLWLLFVAQKAKGEEVETLRGEIRETVLALEAVIENNPALTTPIMDSQAIDINLACLLLERCGRLDFISHWISELAAATRFAFLANAAYPCVLTDYRELSEHPAPSDDYRAEVTCGSILIPTLAVWAAKHSCSDTLYLLSEFVEQDFSLSTLQLWFPGPDSEDHVYLGDNIHGLAFTDLRIAPDGSDMLETISRECEASSDFGNLSAIKSGLWPLLLTASRHHRIPTPPQLWAFPLE